MKMYAIIVKHGFVVIVAFCYNIWLFRNSGIMVLKVVGCEDCVRENKLLLHRPGGETPSRWVILPVFSEKNSHFNAIWVTFCTFLEQLENAKLLRFGRVLKNLLILLSPIRP